MNTEITKEIPALSAAAEWRPLAPAARGVYMSVAAITVFIIALVPTGVLSSAADSSPWLKLLFALVLAFSISGFAAFVAYKRWRNTYWKLDEEALHVKRGKTWFKHICVPRSRVQHLDFERGPLERRYGLATLVVHTAGSHERALRQSGLLLADAEYLRDVLVPKDHRNDE
jgi:membrane protein YdbS with pleckstrin-like domain